MMPVKVNTALIAVTPLGVSPTWWPRAAKTRPSGRLMSTE